MKTDMNKWVRERTAFDFLDVLAFFAGAFLVAAVRFFFGGSSSSASLSISAWI
jgi:hypothetical protein